MIGKQTLFFTALIVSLVMTHSTAHSAWDTVSGQFCTRVGESDDVVEFTNKGVDSLGVPFEVGRPRFWCPLPAVKDLDGDNITDIYVHWQVPAAEWLNIDCAAKFMSRTGTIYTSSVVSDDHYNGVQDTYDYLLFDDPFGGYSLPSIGSMTVYCDLGGYGAAILGLYVLYL